MDGYTLKKVNEYYRFFHPYHTRLDFRGLRSWARHEALKLFSPKSSFCTMECHYYHPYKRPGDYASACGLKGLERELHHGGFNVHYAESVGNDRFTPNLGLIDDALNGDFSDFNQNVQKIMKETGCTEQDACMRAEMAWGSSWAR